MPFRSVSHQTVEVGNTVELVLNQLTILGEHPALMVEHLGESNPGFWSDALAKASANASSGGRGVSQAEEIRIGRIKNRATVAQHAVRDLRGFYHDRADKPGVPDPKHPATIADIPDLIDALPDDVFDSVLVFCLNPNNFRKRAFEGDPKELAGK